MLHNIFEHDNSYRGIPQRALSYRECTQQIRPNRNYQAVVTRTTTFVDNTVLTASQLNSEFNNLLNALGIVNADISGSAAIVASKISGTAAVLNGTQTFTGTNTFGPTIQTITTYTPGAGGTATVDLSKGNLNFITMPAGNVTIALSNATVGQVFVIRITQDSVGSRTVTWFSTIKWSGGNAPTLTTTANKADTFGFIVTSSGNYDGYTIGTNV